jgi:hypothetical protein
LSNENSFFRNPYPLSLSPRFSGMVLGAILNHQKLKTAFSEMLG